MVRKRKAIDKRLQTSRKLNKLMKSEPDYEGRATAANEVWAQLKPWTPDFLEKFWQLVETLPSEEDMKRAAKEKEEERSRPVYKKME